MRIKIGIEADGVRGWRGPGRNIRNLINHMIKIGNNYDFYIYSFNDVSNHIYNGGNVQFIKLPNVPFIPKSNLLLPLAAIKNKIDCMLFPSGNFWLCPVKKSVIILRTGGPDTQTQNIIDKLHSWLQYIVLPFVANTIVTVSNYNAGKIKNIPGYYNKEILIVNNGVDPLFNTCAKTVSNIKKGKYLLYVGGFEKGKNIENLLLGFKICCGENKDLKLYLVGDIRRGRNDSIDVQTIIDRNELNESVFIVGKLSGNELVDIYKNAYIFVFPSLLESFGNAPLEAMACGCPVLASNAPAIPEVCGDAALYFDPYDPQDMADKIKKVLKDDILRKELITKGYQRVKKYTWEESAQKLLAIMVQAVDS